MTSQADNRRKVLIIGAIDRAGTDKLAERGDVEVEVIDQDDPAALEKAADAAGIIVRTALITRELIEAAKDLEVVARHGVGFDNVDVPALTGRGIPLTIAGTANSPTVAEHALYLMLAAIKDGPAYHRETSQGNWSYRDNIVGRDLNGASVLIIGFGRIGSRVTKLCQAFGMRCLVCDPLIDQQRISDVGAEPVADFKKVLGEVDFVTMHAPLNDQTRHMMGTAEFAAMKSTAILINTARGPVVDEVALESALRSNVIYAAGLDVFAVEPPAPDHPLFSLDNVILSPHVAGVTADSVARMSLACAENVLNVFDHCVDPERVVNREVL